MPPHRPIADRLWEKVDVGDCWHWTASLDRHGYGQITDRGRLFRAHVVAWELLVGPVPPDMQLDHRCRNHACLNPDHLELVTQAENIRRGISADVTRRRALAAVKCRNGHPIVPATTGVQTGGWRVCLVCRREWRRRRRAAA